METKSSIARIVWSLTYITLVVIALRFAIAGPLHVRAAPQGQRKVVEEAFTVNPQIRVTKLKIANTPRNFKEEFDETDDWPRRLSLEIENISAKPIVYLQINLNFPETRLSGNLMSYPIRYGVRPGYTDPSSNQPLRLMPGDKLEISVNDHYEKLERFLRTRHTMNQINKAQLEVGFIIFDDGTAWAGDFLRPDPTKPGSYVPFSPTPL